MNAPTVATTVLVPVTTVTRGDTIHQACTDGSVNLRKVTSVRHEGPQLVVDTDRGQMRYSRAAKVRITLWGAA